jgi:hypothetical protein
MGDEGFDAAAQERADTVDRLNELVRRSQHANVKVRDIAADLVDEAPDGTLGRGPDRMNTPDPYESLA